MTRWKTPDYIKKMRDEGKAAVFPLRPWYRSLLHMAWSALQYVFAAVRKLLVRVWVWLKGPWWPRVKSAPAWFLGFAGLYTLFSSFVSMSIGDPLNPNDPFSAPITITNTSTFFTLVNLLQSCQVNKIRHTEPTNIENNNLVGGYSPPIPELLRGNQDTVGCNGEIGHSIYPITFTDVTMRVSYELAVYFFKWRVTVFPFAKRSEARFIAVKSSDGKFRWLPYGLKDFPTPSNLP